VTRRLCCLRGISTLTGFGLVVEVGDWHRLSGASIGSYLGLVPSERSSGDKRSEGGITKTGNTHARRLLTECAWHHKPAYRRGKTILERWAAAPAPLVARADAGNRRLHARWVTLDARKKKHTLACAAIARELAGWCWSLSRHGRLTPQARSRPEGPDAARGATRYSPVSSPQWPRSTSEQREGASRNTFLRCPTREYQTDRAST
jgi:hypothetical protein